MKNVVEAVRFVNENQVVVYLEDRQFNIETTDGNALKLATELLQPYFEEERFKYEMAHFQLKKPA